MPEIELSPLSPFAGMMPLGRGVQPLDRDGCGIVLCTVRNGRRAQFEQAARQAWGVSLPGPGRCARVDGLIVASLGPASWLFVRERSANVFEKVARRVASDHASVVDQSDGLALLRLTGARVRSLIAAGASIDVGADAFDAGQVATTQMAHMTVTLWRNPDAADGVPSFDFALPRSFAVSFWDWLRQHTHD